MMPVDFEDWKDCIERKCKISLTSQFALERLSVYRDRTHSETKEFIRLYGDAHCDRIIAWFSRIAQENP